MHASHAPLKSVEALRRPCPEVKPITVIRTQIENRRKQMTMSKPYASESGYMGAIRRRGGQGGRAR